MRSRKFAVLAAALLVFFGNVTYAQQKPKPKPVTVNVADLAQTVLTRKIRKERKNPALTVMLDTNAPYPISNNAKGVRGTGTIANPKTSKQEMFAYDVQVDVLKAAPVRVAYRLMKGAVLTSEDTPMEYQMTMAHSAVRSKIQFKEGKKMIVTFKSANPVPLTATTTQFKGEGGYSDGKTSKKFRYSATIDAANGRVRGANYTLLPDEKVKR